MKSRFRDHTWVANIGAAMTIANEFKGYVKDLRKSIERTLDEMERVLNR